MCSSLLTATKWFTAVKEKVRCNEEQDELKTSLKLKTIKKVGQ